MNNNEATTLVKSFNNIDLGKSMRLFSSSNKEDIAKIGGQTRAEIRKSLRDSGLSGNALTAAVNERYCSQLGKSTLAGKTLEAAFEQTGAQITNQTARRSKGMLKLVTTRSKFVPVTTEDELATVEAKIALLKAKAAELAAEAKTIEA
ncbi:MAG: hypothetical protein EBT95_08920 [Verrucomicrobia bacterium]|jgi:hypothetical protein|nr:hypothetical protein [Verrucomicrobiota bacterium]